jgi:tRNA(Ile2)-agmatinylcytidine synthase
MVQIWHLGVDDTDSNLKMCTTYLATLLVDFLLTLPLEFLDFPKLIRLNPNIPYKTRGNGAVAISFMAPEKIKDDIWTGVVDRVKQNADVSDPQTDPGLVLLMGEVPIEFTELYKQALFQVVPLKSVKKLLKKYLTEIFYLKKGRGLIGAAAAIGATLTHDYTYELITYRSPNERKAERLIDPISVINADRNTPLSFNNYDYEHNQVMITPHGPDPVFCGIRGETSSAVIQMWSQIKILEPIQTSMIFRSNQHTQVHFPKLFRGDEISPHLSVIVRGSVIKKPYDHPGGHVIFTIKSGNTEIDCAAYEPTKRFRKIIRELLEGDVVQVYGGVRPASVKTPITINIEEIHLLKLVTIQNKIVLKCPICGASLTSAGKNKGVKCKKCSYSSPDKKEFYKLRSRKIRTGVRYVIPVCAQRHLTKPVSRDAYLQFHLTAETNFQKAFYNFLKKRLNLNDHIIHKENSV